MNTSLHTSCLVVLLARDSASLRGRQALAQHGAKVGAAGALEAALEEVRRDGKVRGAHGAQALDGGGVGTH